MQFCSCPTKSLSATKYQIPSLVILEEKKLNTRAILRREPEKNLRHSLAAAPLLRTESDSLQLQRMLVLQGRSLPKHKIQVGSRKGDAGATMIKFDMQKRKPHGQLKI